MADNTKWCIEYLKGVNGVRHEFGRSGFEELRALMNITMPFDLSDEFYSRQDAVLKYELSKKTIVHADELPFVAENVCLFRGDIICIEADAIVNACNSQMLGCFLPLHYCIDNAIHTFAGLQMRRDLMAVMQKQGHDEPNGKCKVTSGYNLLSKYVLHTIGPVYNHSNQNVIDLKNCYASCLKKADEMGLKSIVFCSLSTGVFGYPIEDASKIAIFAVKRYLENENKNIERVVFNLFSEKDYETYNRNIKEVYC